MRKKLDNTKRLASDLGITIWQVHGPFSSGIIAADKKKREKKIDNFKRWMDCCETLGVPYMVIHPGGTIDKSNPVSTKEIKELIIDRFLKLAKHGKNMKLKVAIENTIGKTPAAANLIDRYGQRISDLKEIIKKVGSDSLGICLDTGHANIQGLDIAEAVREAGKLLIATHLADNNGVHDLHAFPFSIPKKSGGIDWLKAIKAFKEINYSKGFICEILDHGYPVEIQDINLKSAQEAMEIAFEDHG